MTDKNSKNNAEATIIRSVHKQSETTDLNNKSLGQAGQIEAADNPDKTRIVKPASYKTETPKKAEETDDSNKTRIVKPVANTTEGETTADDSNKTRIVRQISDKTDSENRNKTQVFGPLADRTQITQSATAISEELVKTQMQQSVAEASQLLSGAEQADNAIKNTDKKILKQRFILEEVLGAGGMGVVYKGKDIRKVEAKDRDPFVAIKVLGEEFKEHPEAFISLQRESRKTQSIAHPNIVTVFDFDKDGDTVFMTMEFMEGKPLDKLLQQYKATGLAVDDAKLILDGMSQALIYAHQKKIIHSDFKPGNVFVTSNGIAKVFDFGIARAVANVQTTDDNPEDRTMFDAGNLGALTPAYASLEMLRGREPDVRDDLYALGCVAYELYTGKHPFNKMPADQAAEKGLKPKRITHIKKHEWRAIEKALSFKREDRWSSVEEFWQAFDTAGKGGLRFAVVTFVFILLAAIVYLQFFQSNEIDISGVEYQIRIDIAKETLNNLLVEPTFTNSWQDRLLEQTEEVKLLILNTEYATQADKDWLAGLTQTIYGLYIKRIETEVEQKNYNSAIALIKNARPYTQDPTELDAKLAAIDAAIKAIADAKAAEEARMQEEARKQDEIRKQNEVEPQPKQPVTATPSSDNIRLSFNTALDNVKQQLQCQSQFNLRELGVAIEKLKSLDKKRYQELEGEFVTTLATCITQISKRDPRRAQDYKNQALRIFENNSTIAAIEIQAKDPCSTSLAGLGANGSRGGCQDSIPSIGRGPALVVIPAANGMRAFAIGRYEISIDEFNQFCKISKSCNINTTQDNKLPITNVDIQQVKQYLQWLSGQTDQVYRLPTLDEWLHAATAKSGKLDPNRNCTVSSQGINRGDRLYQFNNGKQNEWGLMNYVGNAQEMVYRGGQLLAAGGAHTDRIEDCSISTQVPHSGQADAVTGFRVLREIKPN